MKVVAIETIALRDPEPQLDRDWWYTSPMDIFLPDHNRLAPPQFGSVSNVVVRVVTDEGVDGLGSVGLGSPASVSVIEHHLAPQVIGRSPFDVELIWERLFRSTLNMGRKGLVMGAISAIDIALWDIMGKVVGQPVYNLLGGQTRTSLRAYASQSYAREDMDQVREEALAYKRQGFTALKMRAGYGPADGATGMSRNRELVATVRDAIGPETDLMLEAYMGWDVQYAIRMIDMLADFGLAWIEEPVMPDDLDGYARIRAAVRTPIAGGEHEATKFGFREMIMKHAVDYLQPDINRMGGITEARKVWALAAAHNISVIPHSNLPSNAHLVMANLNSPLIEYFPTTGIRWGHSMFQEFFDGVPSPVNGSITLTDAPGLGISLNEAVIELYRIDL